MKYIITMSDVGKDLDSLVKSLKKVKKPKFDPFTIAMPVSNNFEAWFEWCKYREDKKKPISQLAAMKQSKQLSQYTHQEQQQMVDNSIANDWQGLFAPKINNQSTMTTREQLLDTSWAEGMDIEQ